MQDVTDLAFMRVMDHFGGPDFYVTEYFRVHRDSRPEPHILRSIDENETGRPVLAQLIGQDITALVRNVHILKNHPIAGIDLNLGCPAPVVCRKDAGGGLLRLPQKTSEILKSLREACGDTPFTIKTRLGFHQPEEIHDLLPIFQEAHPDLLTIHGRTVQERYQTPVHPELIKVAVEAIPCPVIANGNVVDPETGLALLNQSGAAGLMVGRGAIRHPWLFSELRAAFSGSQHPAVRRSDLLDYIRLLYQEKAKMITNFIAEKHVQKMKRYLVYICQGLDEEFEFQIRRAKSPGQFFAICEDFLQNDQPLPQLPPENSKLFCGFSHLLEPAFARG